MQKLLEKVQKVGGSPSDITEADIQAHLYTHDLPDVDLIIRTSGEQRLSNFLPWQNVYSEIAFVQKPWPAFGLEDFHGVLADFQNRERRYGKISEQL